MTVSEPYRVTLHFDSTISDGLVWSGSGRDLNPACGQSEFISVTPRPDLVDCMKCKTTLGLPS